MSPSDFIHPEDAAALQQMESIPGFAAIVKKVLSIGYETLEYGLNMASNIRLSERQLPEIYRHLPPICMPYFGKKIKSSKHLRKEDMLFLKGWGNLYLR